MSREKEGFRENLQDILEFFHGKRLLTLSDVRRYTGLADDRTIKRRFPVLAAQGDISAVMLARCMSGGDAA